jgi:D-tyrosyl-tRNA(Tyr) deacylase
MIAVVQRVTEAQVTVAGETVGRIERGLVALVAVTRSDTPAEAEWMAGKLAAMRIFRADGKHFEADVTQVGGGILLVSNFTVSAKTKKGRRPSLDGAAEPAQAQELFDHLVAAARKLNIPVATGSFGADMRVSLTNEGPATFIVDSSANE